MKVHLLYPDSDYNHEDPSLWNAEELQNDLGLEILFKTMSNQNNYLNETAKKVLLNSLVEKETIKYRQNVLKDCLENIEVIKDIYSLSKTAIKQKKDEFSFGLFSKSPISVLSGSSNIIKMFVSDFTKLRKIAEKHSSSFKSEGFKRFFNMLKDELNKEYLEDVLNVINNLDSKSGIQIKASLGEGNTCTDFVLQEPSKQNSWLNRVFTKKTAPNSFSLEDQDDIGVNVLREIKNQALNESANTLGQTADQMLDFFTKLRRELAFYIASVNLHKHLIKLKVPVCFPDISDTNKISHTASSLYNPCLALVSNENIQGLDINAPEKEVIIITGANQGGKTSFLRSIGIAQLMMQSGIFVTAESFNANICNGIYTHFQREEDRSINSGKFDEELSRMSEIIKHIQATSMLLCNESFSATNEREGSVIGRQIIEALKLKKIKIFFVTHFFELANYFYQNHLKTMHFLRAPRAQEDKRDYKLVEEPPLKTSFGEDLFNKTFN